ncbi:hypothetical protein HOC37_02250 [bacterium]|jgi:hypothetical protein|nr:hypothetical protein [bacterium]MBT3580708.1 hypothetical protein [bacterium]MBT4551790.1 hypothetical protein [bacterium]MBT5988691.1 hypothetical protein [bacterium]MBT7087949.1 hypothetical protein [bacterium]
MPDSQLFLNKLYETFKLQNSSKITKGTEAIFTDITKRNCMQPAFVQKQAIEIWGNIITIRSKK